MIDKPGCFVRLRYYGRFSTIPATVHGSWAVHRNTDIGRRDYSITHVNTGKRIPSSQTELLTKAQAVEVVRRVDAEIGTRRVTHAVGKRIIEIIHAVLKAAA